MGLLPNIYLTGKCRLEPSIIDKRDFIVDVILPVVDVIVLSIGASHKGTVYDLWVWGITEEIIPCARRREIGTSADKENEDGSQYESRSEDETWHRLWTWPYFGDMTFYIFDWARIRKYVHILLINASPSTEAWLNRRLSQGLYLLNGRTSYRKSPCSFEAARFGFKRFQSLWNLTSTSAAMLPKCLSNFRTIWSS